MFQIVQPGRCYHRTTYHCRWSKLRAAVGVITNSILGQFQNAWRLVGDNTNKGEKFAS